MAQQLLAVHLTQDGLHEIRAKLIADWIEDDGIDIGDTEWLKPPLRIVTTQWYRMYDGKRKGTWTITSESDHILSAVYEDADYHINFHSIEA